MTNAILRATRTLQAQVAPLALFACANIAVVAWYGGQELLWGNDATFPLTLEDISSYFQVTGDGPGSPDARKVPFTIPLGTLLWVWAALGVPYDIGVLQPVVITGLLTAAGWSSYALVRILLPSLGKAAAFVGALFYMFNLYVLTIVWSSMSYLAIHYAFLPAVVTIWLLALRLRDPWLGALSAVVWTLAVTPAYVATPVAATDAALFMSCVVLELVRGPRRFRVAATAAAAYGAWLGLNLVWIVPFVSFASQVWERGVAAGDPSVLFARNSAELHEAVRLTGYWGLGGYWSGTGSRESWYLPWYPYYRDIGHIVAWAAPLLAVFGLANTFARLGSMSAIARAERVYLGYFTAVLAAAVLLMTGAHAPFGDLKSSLAAELSLDGPFRSVYQRFAPYAALAFAPLVAAGTAAAIALARSRVRGWRGLHTAAVAAAIAMLVAVLPVLPMWTGQAFDRSGINASRRITIPDEYRAAASIIDAYEGDFAVVSLPYRAGGSGPIPLKWMGGDSGYNGIEPLALLSEKTFLTGDGGAPHLAELASDVASGGPRALRALRLMNARFVVIHNDRAEVLHRLPGWVGVDVQRIDDRLERLPGIRGVALSELLRVYEWQRWRPAYFFSVTGADSDASLAVDDLETAELETVTYRRLGSGHYEVHGLEAGSLLVVNKPFDRGWRANGERPFSVEPGLTAFEVRRSGPVVVTHAAERRMPALFAGTGALLVLLLAGAARSHLATRPSSRP